MKRLLLIVATAALLAACAGRDAPKEQRDGPSGRSMDPGEIRDAQPRAEPRARYGNHSPYTVLGKTYTVMDSAEGYRERGIASWYGTKFHGRKTSSGEPYDMHAATAAHKRLPLPTYAEVTNLDNGRKVVVKVNDRGPFHEDRIIDLSYAAAIKIGMAEAGTARVEVRAITFDEPVTHTFTGDLDGEAWLQAGAFSKKRSAKDLEDALEDAGLDDVSVDKSGRLYKVYLGPYDEASKLNADANRIVELGYERPHKVSR